MDEILYELERASGGLPAGDGITIFSVIKKLRSHARVCPARTFVGYMQCLHERHTPSFKCDAIAVALRHGGRLHFIPNRSRPEVTEGALSKVTEDSSEE